MRSLILILLMLPPLLGLSQGMKINWRDSDGREFSINTHSGDFEYSMLAGDQLSYNTGSFLDTGPEGTIKQIGTIAVNWNRGTFLDTGPVGTIKNVGDITVTWNRGTFLDTGPEGTIKAVGGLTVYYNTGSFLDTGPEGTIKSTSGSVR